jgi:hypothetical protein
MTLVTQAEYARRLGVTPAAVSQWKSTGLLVLQGRKVDMEASDARLAYYRREGLPDVLNGNYTVKRGRPAAGTAVDLAALAEAARNIQPVKLRCVEIEQRLAALDWTLAFDWSDEAQDERARLAARCVGFEAVQSDLHDATHWQEFQLRNPRWIRDGVFLDGAVIVGYGFEADAAEILDVCRNEVCPDEPGDCYTLNLALLPLLAYPHYEGQLR